MERTDLAALLSLYQHLHAEDEPFPEHGRAVWDEIVRDPCQLYLGAFAGDQLVAACNAIIVPNLTRGARPYAVIENVVTHACYRRQGIGGRVMRELLARCWSRRCYKAMLLSGLGRAEVYGFYLALGFDRASKQAFVMTAP